MKNTHVYCDACSSIQPMQLVQVGGDAGAFRKRLRYPVRYVRLHNRNDVPAESTGADALRDLIRQV